MFMMMVYVPPPQHDVMITPRVALAAFMLALYMLGAIGPRAEVS